jgi:peptidoglycan hydrolase-like protein with peptidoglycan-binding domain
MRKIRFVFMGLAGLLFLAGCGTARSASRNGLESRVQTLENRVSVLESDVQASGALKASTAGEVVTGSVSGAASAEQMTKKQIQEALKNSGYYDGEIDGKVGQKTKEAIRQFQKNMGLKVDGVAGRNTKEKLLKYLP